MSTNEPSPPEQPPGRPPEDREAGLARNLGRFFGAVKRGFTQPVKPGRPDDPRRVETRRQATEEQRETPHGPVTLRRTVIEEVEMPPRTTGQQPPRSPTDAANADAAHDTSRDAP